MSNNYIQGPGGVGNNHPAGQRRDPRVPAASGFNGTGPLPSTINSASIGRGYIGAFDFDEMIASLRELFARDRQIASQQDSTRCGVCYLHFTLGELRYREEEGFYVCPTCERTLGKHILPMLRQQQK
ncbi:MAG TPA: hypothetical protein VGD98_20225 [Ktedonobacteraceae bacterium]